jgi:hypothetical protein
LNDQPIVDPNDPESWQPDPELKTKTAKPKLEFQDDGDPWDEADDFDKELYDNDYDSADRKSSSRYQAEKVSENDFDCGKAHFTSDPEKGLFWETWVVDEETGTRKRTRKRIGNHLAPRAIASY